MVSVRIIPAIGGSLVSPPVGKFTFYQSYYKTDRHLLDHVITAQCSTLPAAEHGTSFPNLTLGTSSFRIVSQLIPGQQLSVNDNQRVSIRKKNFFPNFNKKCDFSKKNYYRSAFFLLIFVINYDFSGLLRIKHSLRTVTLCE